MPWALVELSTGTYNNGSLNKGCLAWNSCFITPLTRSQSIVTSMDRLCLAPINAWATALWHAALKREGYDRGLRRPDGTIIDWLAGNVVVICSTEIVDPKYVLIHS